MRVGPFEIVIIIVILLVGLLIVRMAGVARNIRNNTKSAVQNQSKDYKSTSTKSARRYARIAGIGIIIIGIILLLSGINLFKWAVWSYTWFFILLAIGFVIVFMTKRK